jgi:hypothetical protein
MQMGSHPKAGFLVFAVLGSLWGEALAGKTVIRTDGAEASASFDRVEPLICADGSAASRTTSVHLSMSEGTTATGGDAVTVLRTSAGVARFDGCTFLSSFAFGLFEGVGSLQVTALKTGRMTGIFTLDDGTTLDANLALSGSDTISSGMGMQRSILGKTMIIQRSKGKSCTAALAGTVAVDGRVITQAEMTNPYGTLGRNTGGEITLLKP